ncbi:hypothetical protein [Anabaena sp. UHCC 0399]|uniref:hypothetical protein n=1 Tax=Anabaena sp. UHCC 0399 TaxID=3110238 RepID=UPI002B1F718A|nr:hypothetical protein [Anabaena sp. UHCC 0399]MEA5567766.1 hypothetical protein [Anabaena sp. UHCC 0399]
MNEKIRYRLQSLKSEFEAGKKMLADLEAKQSNLRDTLLRISGAIQVLEEVLNEASETNGNNSHPPENVSAEVVTTAGNTSL